MPYEFPLSRRWRPILPFSRNPPYGAVPLPWESTGSQDFYGLLDFLAIRKLSNIKETVYDEEQ